MKTRDEIITAALRKCGALGDGETASTEQVNAGASALISLVKAFAADGMQIWKIEQVTAACSLFPDSQGESVGVGQTVVTSTAPLKLIGAWRSEIATGQRSPLAIWTRQEYMDMANPETTGAPIAVYFQPVKTTGVLHVYPVPDSVHVADWELILDFQTQYTEITSSSTVLDFPDHWEQTLIYSLAQRLAPEYGVAINERNLLTQDSERFRQEALAYSNEEGSVFLRPNRYR